MLQQYQNEEGILIIPSTKKTQILKDLTKMSGFTSLRIMTFDEFKDNFYFSHDEKTIHYLIKEKNIKVSIAHTYLENMIYIEDTQYKSKKLNFLVSLKKELNCKKLLYKNDIFRDSLSRKKILVFPSTIDSNINIMIEKLKQITTVVLLEEDQKKDIEREVLSFSCIEEETRYIAESITNLKKQGIPFSSIHLLNVTSEYQVVLPRILDFYNIPHAYTGDSFLYATTAAHLFLTLLESEISLSEIIEKLKVENIPYLEEIIRLCNKYMFIKKDDKLRKEIFVDLLKQTKIEKIEYEEMIQIDPLYLEYTKDDYVFILGFNQENIPKTWKDEEYLNDQEKQEIGLITANEKNKQEKTKLARFISLIDNVVITYKKTSPFQSFYPSSFIEEQNFKVIEKELKLDKIKSVIDHKIQYAKQLDLLLKYGVISESMDVYYHHFKEMKYQTYCNKFTGIDKEYFNEYIKQKLVLSYSSLDKYYRCSFRYYVGQILKLEPYEETFAQGLGSLFHQILSLAFTPNFDLEKVFKEEINKKTWSKKENFFLKKLKEELLFIIETIKEQHDLSALTNLYLEKKIYIEKKNNIKTTFMGIVDKLMYQEENGNTYVSIIDYKTGTPETNINNTIHGIEMQLPVYLYLVQNSELFQNVVFTGFYLQKILNNEINIQQNKTYKELKKERLRLSGYSSNEEYLVEKVDVDYQNSSVIQGMKITSKGFAHYSKVISREDMTELTNLVDKKIEEAITRILSTDFEINPKIIGLKNKGCEYCSFSELCFKTDLDRVYLREYKNLDFLGGDTNA